MAAKRAGAFPEPEGVQEGACRDDCHVQRGDDHLADVRESLLAIADAAGRDWLEGAHEACVTLVSTWRSFQSMGVPSQTIWLRWGPLTCGDQVR
ncbi:DUF3631 domain-containing protein [Streptomyces sp. NPDC058001]|uniref:DUF3631 domain-containing protein n=1 Tax=Streptomyces sp. NPDC058001 TaxID=3346300 RepID=UPI0036E36533